MRLTGVDLDVERLGHLDAVDAYLSKWGPLRVEGRLVPLGTMAQNELLRVVHTGKALGRRLES